MQLRPSSLLDRFRYCLKIQKCPLKEGTSAWKWRQRLGQMDTSFRWVHVGAGHQRRGPKSCRNPKREAYELANGVTCFLMRGNIGIKNLAI